MKRHSLLKRSSFAIACMLIFLTGCHHPKNISKTENGPTPPQVGEVKPIDGNVDKLLQQLKSNEPDFKEVAAKMKTKVTSPTLNQSFTTNIRWKKGEKIWMSMSIIGIEGARVLITKDSIKIMDKINSRYIIKPLSYIKQKTLTEFTFSDIEKIMLGQLVFTDTAKAKYADNPTNVTISADGMRYLTNVLFDKSTKNLTEIFVTDKTKPITVESTYGNYETQLGKNFSMDRNLKVKSGLDVFQLDGKIQTIELKQNLEYPFPINPEYTIER